MGLAAAAAIALVLVSSSGAGSSALRARIHCDDNAAVVRGSRHQHRLRGDVRRPRRAVLALLLEHARLGELEHVRASRCRRIRRRCPTRTAPAATCNFQLHPAFWLGHGDVRHAVGARVHARALHARQRHEHLRQRRAERARSTSGKHPGTAFMEMQFYPPGWVPWPAGDSCDATKWCAALNIFSLNLDQNTGAAEQRRLPDQRRPRAGQLRVHHEERRPALARRLRSRCSRRPFTAFTPNPRRTCS